MARARARGRAQRALLGRPEHRLSSRRKQRARSVHPTATSNLSQGPGVSTKAQQGQPRRDGGKWEEEDASLVLGGRDVALRGALRSTVPSLTW